MKPKPKKWPVVVSAAVIRRDGKLLLTRRRRGAHFEGFWEFPGGKVEPDESPEDALIRECREECAIEVEPIDILDVTFHRYIAKNVLLLFYDTRLVSGEVQHIEVADHAWITIDEIDRYELPPPDAKVVSKLKRGI